MDISTELSNAFEYLNTDDDITLIHVIDKNCKVVVSYLFHWTNGDYVVVNPEEYKYAEYPIIMSKRIYCVSNVTRNNNIFTLQCVLDCPNYESLTIDITYDIKNMKFVYNCEYEIGTMIDSIKRSNHYMEFIEEYKVYPLNKDYVLNRDYIMYNHSNNSECDSCNGDGYNYDDISNDRIMEIDMFWK